MAVIPESVDGRVIATVELTDSATGDEKNEMVERLDDGNNYPGFQVQKVDGTMYVTAD